MKRKFDFIGDGVSRNDYGGFEESHLDQDSGDEQVGSFDATESKAEKNRERNREHAKRTRQRKKEMIEGMKMRLLDLQREAARLEQLLEESNTANILLCLSVRPESAEEGINIAGLPAELVTSESVEDLQAKISKGNIIDHLRQRVRAEAAQQREKQLDHVSSSTESNDMDADQQAIGMYHPSFQSYTATYKAGQEIDFHAMEQDANHPADNFGGVDINLKTGMTTEDIKRERNRMHAKLTRDRKKLFTSRMQQTIQALERHNQMIRSRLHSMITTGGMPNLQANAAAMREMLAPMSTAGFREMSLPSGFRDVNAFRNDNTDIMNAVGFDHIQQLPQQPSLNEGTADESSPIMQGLMMSMPMPMALPLVMPWSLPPNAGHEMYADYAVRRPLPIPSTSSTTNPAESG